ncbi:MAG: hypothetical protein QOH48_821 [Actinomycetota bacterium]|nr:hypothetical protein [Actinomycetota bacterium]
MGRTSASTKPGEVADPAAAIAWRERRRVPVPRLAVPSFHPLHIVESSGHVIEPGPFERILESIRIDGNGGGSHGDPHVDSLEPSLLAPERRRAQSAKRSGKESNEM